MGAARPAIWVRAVDDEKTSEDVDDGDEDVENLLQRLLVMPVMPTSSCY